MGIARRRAVVLSVAKKPPPVKARASDEDASVDVLRYLTIALQDRSRQDARRLALLGIIIYVASPIMVAGRIVVNDPKATRSRLMTAKFASREDSASRSTLKAGEHDFKVNWSNGEFQTKKFVVRRGTTNDLNVEYEPKLVENRHKDTVPREQPNNMAKCGKGSKNPPKQETASSASLHHRRSLLATGLWRLIELVETEQRSGRGGPVIKGRRSSSSDPSWSDL